MSEKKHYHFVGICGTAMGSVAVAMKRNGFSITGSDENVYPPMSTFLSENGIEILSGYRAEHVPAEADVIVIGNAVSRGNEEAEEALNRKLLYMSLPEVLKEQFLRGKRNFVVTGTHGKTTTASMLTWLLRVTGNDPSFMIGGIPRNLGRGAMFTDSKFVVLEGDEYDTAFFDKRSKFLHYLPEVVTINNIEFDHADIYSSLDEIKLTFKRLLNIVPKKGMAIVNGDDENVREVIQEAPCPVTKVGFGKECDICIEGVNYQREGSAFCLKGERYHVPMVGEFNVRNAATAILAAQFAGISSEALGEGLATFSGIARRQELRGEVRGIKVVDDFAHHPTAITQAIAGMRQQYPGSRLWVLFEPRSNTTKRNVFQDELATALSKADLVVIPAVTDMAKVAVEERLDPKRLEQSISAQGTPCWHLETVEEIVCHVVAQVHEGDVVAVLSNGGFGGIHTRLLEQLDASRAVEA